MGDFPQMPGPNRVSGAGVGEIQLIWLLLTKILENTSSIYVRSKNITRLQQL